MNRPELLATLARHALSVQLPHPTRVAIDGCSAEAERRYLSKYLPGERRYVEEVDPASRAQIVVDNTAFEEPRLYSVR